MTLPSWLLGLLAERYPRPPGLALPLLTLALRPAATNWLPVPRTPEQILSGEVMVLLMYEVCELPPPIFGRER